MVFKIVCVAIRGDIYRNHECIPLMYCTGIMISILFIGKNSVVYKYFNLSTDHWHIGFYITITVYVMKATAFHWMESRNNVCPVCVHVLKVYCVPF
jgi:hypothetical protein